jgi:hypothetical protein
MNKQNYQWRRINSGKIHAFQDGLKGSYYHAYSLCTLGGNVSAPIPHNEQVEDHCKNCEAAIKKIEPNSQPRRSEK